ncbi:Phytoene dehydrogenase or related enzyme [Halalkaliarchaeum sp. AArc-CO]|uniref:phytoene desaturase family protein n=1 Tax=Halalkaliarchaeum sp. AArc-CO TaxID=2866381 RepID=UPI00217D97E2|nr:phytoene desaturase family protein [Halalkaliarchaeum sp. AArc-CO]UWG50547.1 Phytoene dehydrogenase or related enzyme [Halalkaliarchaeum sp. AArc-CO]
MDDAVLRGESIAIVGSGFGGLSAGAYLGAAGADVTVYEKNEHVGGVAGRLERDGFRFDTGPSWYLMPEVFENFFAAFGADPSDYYDLIRLDPNYRVFWRDGERADVPADPTAAAELFESYESGAGEALERYLDQAEEAYDVGMNRFVRANRTRFRDYISLDVFRSARGISFLGTMDDHVAEYFENPRLRQLVQYTLVFLGGSPHNTPALYTLMSHVDYGLGVYYPQGGITAVVDAVESVATDQGATVHTGVEVTRLAPEHGGIELATADGTVQTYDRVVCNAPIAHVERELLPAGSTDRSDGYWDSRTYAPSAYMLYLGVEGGVDPLKHHTLLLPTDWDPHFETIFEEPGWPEDPAMYVNVPSQTDPDAAPDGCETVVVLVPIAPGLEDTPTRREGFRESVLDAIAEDTGVELRGRIRTESTACVSEFAERYRKPEGTALGLAHTLRQTGPLRPRHRAPGVDRLYYVGDDTNPGIGVPMCLLSGKHVTEAVRSDANGNFLANLIP